ncbi:MAG: SAM-dependent methyltransferase [Chitinophagaceae bacterium]|nr:SAM-dependent methyltransferase [Chitinophagaceae bacterium]
MEEKRKSELCKAKDWQTGWYQRWCREMNESPRFHRKQWEFVFVMQALWERDCIEKNKKGLVFAVGTEPCPSIFAKYGCDILATDIQTEKGIEMGWNNGDQLCFGIESLNQRKLCDDKTFREHVTYQPVDMNDIPNTLTGFDFNWSSCSFEHLGSIEKGFLFLKNQLKTLKPGGWAVHTTEFNISSNEKTIETGDTVVYRKRDLDAIAGELRSMGHFVEETDFSSGDEPEDLHIDFLPHKQDIHLKLQLDDFVVTSIGLIIRKSETPG